MSLQQTTYTQQEGEEEDEFQVYLDQEERASHGTVYDSVIRPSSMYSVPVVFLKNMGFSDKLVQLALEEALELKKKASVPSTQVLEQLRLSAAVLTLLEVAGAEVTTELPRLLRQITPYTGRKRVRWVKAPTPQEAVKRFARPAYARGGVMDGNDMALFVGCYGVPYAVKKGYENIEVPDVDMYGNSKVAGTSNYAVHVGFVAANLLRGGEVARDASDFTRAVVAYSNALLTTVNIGPGKSGKIESATIYSAAENGHFQKVSGLSFSNSAPRERAILLRHMAADLKEAEETTDFTKLQTLYSKHQTFRARAPDVSKRNVMGHADGTLAKQINAYKDLLKHMCDADKGANFLIVGAGDQHITWAGLKVKMVDLKPVKGRAAEDGWEAVRRGYFGNFSDGYDDKIDAEQYAHAPTNTTNVRGGGSRINESSANTEKFLGMSFDGTPSVAISKGFATTVSVARSIVEKSVYFDWKFSDGGRPHNSETFYRGDLKTGKVVRTCKNRFTNAITECLPDRENWPCSPEGNLVPYEEYLEAVKNMDEKLDLGDVLAELTLRLRRAVKHSIVRNVEEVLCVGGPEGFVDKYLAKQCPGVFEKFHMPDYVPMYTRAVGNKFVREADTWVDKIPVYAQTAAVFNNQTEAYETLMREATVGELRFDDVEPPTQGAAASTDGTPTASTRSTHSLLSERLNVRHTSQAAPPAVPVPSHFNMRPPASSPTPVSPPPDPQASRASPSMSRGVGRGRPEGAPPPGVGVPRPDPLPSPVNP